MKRAGVFTKLNLHLAALGLLIAINIFLAVKYGLAWRAIGSDQSTSFAQEQIRYGQLQAQMQHLNGLPEKVQLADQDAQKFYDNRIAPNYSTIAAALGEAAAKDQVRLARAEYAPQTAIDGLEEVRIDAGLSGEYTSLMHFINDLERDKDHIFFIVDGLAFTGQQGGLVNLRLRLTTYIRSGATDIPAAPENAANLQPAAEGTR
jgi:type IV pilus assembly protein PilO